MIALQINDLLTQLYNFHLTGVDFLLISRILTWSYIGIVSLLPTRFTLLGLVASAPVTTMSALSLSHSDLVPSQILLWVCAAKMLYFLCRNKERPEKHFLLFALYALLSIPVSLFVHDWIVNLDGQLALSGFSKTQLTQWEHLLSAIICCCLVSGAIKRKMVTRKEVLNAVNAGLVFVLGVALLQFLFTPDMVTPLFRNVSLASFKNGKDRLSSTFYEPSFLAAYLMPLTALNAVLLVRRPSFTRATLIAAVSAVTLQNYSSTGLLGLGVVVCFTLYELVLLMRQSEHKRFHLAVLVLAILLGIVVVLNSGVLDEALNKLIMTVGGKGESGETRLSNIVTMGAVFLRHPLFGVGFGTGRCESLLFTWLPELGLIGISLFVVPLVDLFIKLARNRSTESRAILGALVSYSLIYVVSVSEIYHLTFWIILGVGFSLVEDGAQGGLWCLMRKLAFRLREAVSDGTSRSEKW